MTLSEINTFIANSNSEDELLAINAALIGRIKRLRSIKAHNVASTLTVGDTVEWSGRRGHMTGELIKINRKNAKVKVGMATWTVPMNMLSAA
ncbi:MAG TPA: hypothetical protein EYQ00_11250 [Dehalococcoidia bacterium]|jgi:hypothetical protein|nr:hypothetical protein [Dehalococcoidia bacterium]